MEETNFNLDFRTDQISRAIWAFFDALPYSNIHSKTVLDLLKTVYIDEACDWDKDDRKVAFAAFDQRRSNFVDFWHELHTEGKKGLHPLFGKFFEFSHKREVEFVELLEKELQPLLYEVLYQKGKLSYAAALRE